MINQSTETIVVGGGIVGLACAWAAARAGQRVVLFERHGTASGASVRNFGLLWPVGQPEGPLHDLAMRSREIWATVIQSARLWHAPTGSLHLAHHPDEEQVLLEYLDTWRADEFGRRMMLPREVDHISPTVKAHGLRSALWSPTEINIDPREAIRTLPRWLEEKHGVTLRFGHGVRAVGSGFVETAEERWEADSIIICSGADFEQFYPDVFRDNGLKKVKLQMLRTVPQPAGWNLGPSICAGLTLIHYPAFENCASLDSLRGNLRERHGFCVENGIHLLVSQTREGEITLGDSHHYGADIQPFDREDINQHILDYFRSFALLPKLELKERWHGIYAKQPQRPWIVVRPEPGVTLVNGLGGAGMTFSFGLAEAVIAGEEPDLTPDRMETESKEAVARP